MNPAYNNWTTIRTIITLREQGHSYRDIATLLNIEGTKSATGGNWHGTTVRRVHNRASVERRS